MAEAEEPSKDVTQKEPARASTPPPEQLKEQASPGTGSKLLDAGLLVFIITAFSLSTSVFYVMGLSIAFRYSIHNYFELKDYVDITVYWLGPVLGLLISFLPLGQLVFSVKTFLLLRKRTFLQWCAIGCAALMIALIIGAFYLVDKRMLTGAFLLILFPLLASSAGNAWLKDFAAQIKSRPFIRYSV